MKTMKKRLQNKTKNENKREVWKKFQKNMIQFMRKMMMENQASMVKF